MKIYNALFFLILTNFCFSQRNTLVRENFSVTISPLSLIDVFDGSSIRIGADMRLTNNVRFSFEAGSYYKELTTYKIKPIGFIIKPEIKFCVITKSENNQYLGIEYQYKEQAYDFKDSISINHGDNFEKQYSIKRKMNCISLKYSCVEKISKKITFEYFGGFGIRFLRSSNNLTKEENEGILDDEIHGGTQAEYQIRPIGKINTVNFIAGIKLGYILI
ncbi:MAG: hypothetical protein RI980_1250 [Bacteroidota bacterium]|jgi:hypothetical protein